MFATFLGAASSALQVCRGGFKGFWRLLCSVLVTGGKDNSDTQHSTGATVAVAVQQEFREVMFLIVFFARDELERRHSRHRHHQQHWRRREAALGDTRAEAAEKRVPRVPRAEQWNGNGTALQCSSGALSLSL